MEPVAMNREASANYVNNAVRKPAAAAARLCGLLSCPIKSFFN